MEAKDLNEIKAQLALKIKDIEDRLDKVGLINEKSLNQKALSAKSKVSEDFHKLVDFVKKIKEKLTHESAKELTQELVAEFDSVYKKLVENIEKLNDIN